MYSLKMCRHLIWMFYEDRHYAQQLYSDFSSRPRSAAVLMQHDLSIIVIVLMLNATVLKTVIRQVRASRSLSSTCLLGYLS